MQSNQEERAVKFGRRLKSERQRLKLTQSAFAELAKVARPTQYLYETGVRSPSSDYLMDLSENGVDINYLLNLSMPEKNDKLINKSIAKQIYLKLEKEITNDALVTSQVDRFEALCDLFYKHDDGDIDWNAFELLMKSEKRLS